MKPPALRIAAAALCLALALSPALGAHADTLSHADTPSADKKLSIDRLYSLPWVIGSQPQDPVWSPDSRRLAFLWNDNGSNFYDVWMTDVKSGKPVRVTSMPGPPRAENPGKDIEQLTQVERAEKDHGVSAVQWEADSKHLIFSFHARLYRVVPGEAPQRLTRGDAEESNVVAAPRAERIAYLSAGDLWVMDLGGDGVEARKLYAPGLEDIGVEAMYWSPDGKRLAFIETDLRNVRERGIPDYLAEETRMPVVKRAFPGEPSESRRVGLIDASGGAVQWLSLQGNPFDQIFSVAWSPDGSALLVDTSDLYIKERRLMLADPATGRARQLLREVDPHNVTAEWWADWAPDAKGVYFIS